MEFGHGLSLLDIEEYDAPKVKIDPMVSRPTGGFVHQFRFYVKIKNSPPIGHDEGFRQRLHHSGEDPRILSGEQFFGRMLFVVD